VDESWIWILWITVNKKSKSTSNTVVRTYVGCIGLNRFAHVTVPRLGTNKHGMGGGILYSTPGKVIWIGRYPLTSYRTRHS
jgi:hypothetical protein